MVALAISSDLRPLSGDEDDLKSTSVLERAGLCPAHSYSSGVALCDPPKAWDFARHAPLASPALRFVSPCLFL